MVRRVGIIGFGHLGQFLTSRVQNSNNHELAFVWNRTRSAVAGKIDEDLILQDLNDFADRNPDIVVEVAHPSLTKLYGKKILSVCDFMVGSPTVFCEAHVEQELQASCGLHSLYVPSGAFWGGEDIQKMADEKKIQSLKVTMKKHPMSLKLEGQLKEKNAAVSDKATVLYEGPARHLCKLAPQNTNTIAAAALAAHNLGFDGIVGCLVSDPNLIDRHIVEIEVKGFPNSSGLQFQVHTIRQNPANIGEVTGLATYDAYFTSLKRAQGKNPGLHLC